MYRKQVLSGDASIVCYGTNGGRKHSVKTTAEIRCCKSQLTATSVSPWPPDWGQALELTADSSPSSALKRSSVWWRSHKTHLATVYHVQWQREEKSITGKVCKRNKGDEGRRGRTGSYSVTVSWRWHFCTQPNCPGKGRGGAGNSRRISMRLADGWKRSQRMSAVTGPKKEGRKSYVAGVQINAKWEGYPRPASRQTQSIYQGMSKVNFHAG